MKKFYEAWTNERLDAIIKNKSFNRVSDVDRWKDKVRFHCTKCGNDFETIPSNIKLGTGCPHCRRIEQKDKRRKPKYTLQEVKNICLQQGWKVLDDEYVNSSTKMKMKCTKCGHIMEKQFRLITSGFVKCPECKKRTNR